MTSTPIERSREELFAELDKPINENRVVMRDAGRGRRVPYVEGFDVIDEANHLFGYDGWHMEVIETRLVSAIEAYGKLRSVYSATVRVTVPALGGIVRQDVGTCITDDDRPEAHDTAIKGAATDAMKRAFRTLGNQFGNSLYDKNPPAKDEACEQPAERPMQARQAAPADAPFKKPGDLLNWALASYGMTRAQVLKVAKVDDPVKITDLMAVKAEIERLQQQVGARS